MTVGLLHIDLLIPEARSLKDKRRVVKSLKAQIRNRYNCSVAETDYHDLWQRARICIAVVSNESRHANTQLNEILRFTESRLGANVADCQIEML